jgi:FtsP/CotA-like multicopper oxidase with cupredoxin domain
LKLGALGAGSVLLPLGRLGLSIADSQASSPPVPLFKLALPIPTTAQAVGTTTVTTPDGTPTPADVYELTETVGEAQILPGFKPTRIWGYNGQAPGPIFRVQSGKPIVVRHTNALTTAATGSIDMGISTHLHGGNVDGFSDGHPFNLVPPGGGTKQHTYFNDQPAATMWYHDHAIDHTARNVYHGLASFYLLTDANEDSLGLPSGDFDIPLVIQSKFFNADGSLNFPPGDRPETAPGEGILGDTVMVNGAAWPFLNVQRRKYRFRLLDGSDSREFLLALSTGQSFIQIATEGGLVPGPVPQRMIHITPAERYEVVIDFSIYPGGTNVVLQNLLESGNLANIMQFRVQPGTVTDTSQVPNQLMASDLQASFNSLQQLAADLRAREQRGAPPPPQITQFRNFRFERDNGGFAINGKFFDLDRDDAVPQAGTFEVWNLENDSGGWFHPVHLHLLHAGFGFIVVDRNGVPIRRGDQEFGWKETVNLGRNNESLRVLMQWPSVPVNPNNRLAPAVPGERPFDFFQRRYVFHCHNIDHEDHDMMAQIRVAT